MRTFVFRWYWFRQLVPTMLVLFIKRNNSIVPYKKYSCFVYLTDRHKITITLYADSNQWKRAQGYKGRLHSDNIHDIVITTLYSYYLIISIWNLVRINKTQTWSSSHYWLHNIVLFWYLFPFCILLEHVVFSEKSLEINCRWQPQGERSSVSCRISRQWFSHAFRWWQENWEKI